MAVKEQEIEHDTVVCVKVLQKFKPNIKQSEILKIQELLDFFLKETSDIYTKKTKEEQEAFILEVIKKAAIV